jgi:predicted glycoside hydrolase/deacetylase ChbG (UPF0249 family)
VNEAAVQSTDLEAIEPSLAARGTARSICLCVDDFGMHPGIDSAALRLAEMGRVHAVSCMVGGNSWSSSSPLLRPMVKVDVGLHLDFTESPLLTGSRRTLPAMVFTSHLRWLDSRAIRAEIRAQLDAFEQAMGRSPSFIDGHQHVHQLPMVRNELLAELQARASRLSPWIRSTRAPRVGPSGLAGIPGLIKPRVVESLGARRLSAEAKRFGHKQNKHLLGVYDFRGGSSRYLTLLARWCRHASNGDLLMCHPSESRAEGDPLIEARCCEFDVLCGEAFEVELQRAQLLLAPMHFILST